MPRGYARPKWIFRWTSSCIRGEASNWLADPRLAALPLAYREPLRSALGPCLDTSNESGPVRELARSVAEGTGWQTLVFLTALNRSLFETFRHVVRDDGPPHPPEITFRTKEASCRDLAMLFCAACRSMGIAARFVSGYERGAALQKQAYMHAWAEVYLAGDGWRGYNPSQGLAVANSHVAVAAAADPKLAAPLSGSYWAFSGPASPTVVQAANILSSAFQRAPRPVRRLTCAVKGKDRADA